MQVPSLSSGCEIAQFFGSPCRGWCDGVSTDTSSESFYYHLGSLDQPSATSPLFFDNLHFEHFDKSVNLDSWLTFLSKCSKWGLSEKRGLVADDW
jgi:hypothetical protein